MPRSEDYQINEVSWKTPYDIVIDDNIGLNFFGETPVKGRFGPGELNQTNSPGEYPIIFNDYSNGMGMAYSGIPNTYAFAINGYNRTKRKFMPGGKLTEVDLTTLGDEGANLEGEIRCGLEWGGDIYFGLGQHIAKIQYGYEEPTLDYDVGDGCQVDSALVYNGVPLFSTDQTFDNWQYLTGHDGVAWKTANWDGLIGDYSVRTGAENYEEFPSPVYLEKMRKYFQEVDGVGGNRIVGNDSFFTTIQTQSLDIDEIIGDESVYSAPVQIGDSTYAITGIYESNRMFIVTKADGVYGVENGGVYTPNYTTTLRESPSLYNGVSGIFFDGKFFGGTQEGVMMVDLNDRQRIDVPKLVSPSYFYSNETPIFGIPTAMTTDNGWVVTSLWNGADSHICYLRPREETDAEKTDAPVIWHGSECTIVGERITFMLKSYIWNRPTMYIGTHDGENCHLYMLSLPREGDPYTDFLQDQGHEFTTDCRLYLPFQDAEDPNARKFVRRYDIQADGLTLPELDPDTGELLSTISAGELDFYANADSGSRIFFESVDPSAVSSEWQYQGIIATSPKASMIPTTGATSGSQIGVLIVGRLVNQGTDEAPVYSPFAIRSIKVRADLIIEQLEVKTYTISLGHLGATNSGRDHSDMQRKFSILVAYQDTDAVYMIDENGERVLVKIEPGIQYYIKKESFEQPYTYVVEFEVTYIGRQFIYDIGHAYDSVYAWGN